MPTPAGALTAKSLLPGYTVDDLDKTIAALEQTVKLDPSTYMQNSMSNEVYWQQQTIEPPAQAMSTNARPVSSTALKSMAASHCKSSRIQARRAT